MSTELHTSPPSEGRFRKEQVFIIAGGHFIHDVYSAFLAPLLPLLIEKFSLTLAMAGSLSAFMQVPALLNPLIGRLADRSNTRYFVVFAPAVTATLMSVMGVASSYYALAAILIVAGISVASFHSPAPAMVASFSGRRVGKGMGWFMAGGELGRTLGPLLAVWAASTWTLEGMARVAVLGWVTSLVLFFRLDDISLKKTERKDLREILPKFRSVFLPLASVLFFRTFMTVSMTTYLPVFMNGKGASLWLSGASLSIMESAGVLGALWIGSFSDKVGRKKVFLFASVTSFLLMLAFLRLKGWVLIPVLLAFGFSSLSLGPVFLALIQDHFPNHRSAANGAYMFLVFLLRSLAMFLVGSLGDKIGLERTFFLSAFFSLLVIPGIFFLPPDSVLSAD